MCVRVYRCSRSLERGQSQHDARCRPTKASISSPSSARRQMEMKRNTDSSSSGFIDGPDAEHYGLAATTFLPGKGSLM